MFDVMPSKVPPYSDTFGRRGNLTSLSTHSRVHLDAVWNKASSTEKLRVLLLFANDQYLKLLQIETQIHQKFYQVACLKW
jgi:hypothetical protein